MTMFRIEHPDGSYLINLPEAETDHIQKVIQRTGLPYELKMLEDMASRLSPGDLVLDLGANIGNHTLFLAAIAKSQVVAFEPNERLVTSLNSSIAANKLASSITVMPLGVGASPSAATLHSPSRSNSGRQLLQIGEGPVKVTTLDDIHFNAPVKAIKMDIERMEVAALRGGDKLIARDRPILYIELQDLSAFREMQNWAEQAKYFHVSTFNATPTHLFMPAEAVSLEQKLSWIKMDLAATNYKIDALRTAERKRRQAERVAIKQVTSVGGGAGLILSHQRCGSSNLLRFIGRATGVSTAMEPMNGRSLQKRLPNWRHATFDELDHDFATILRSYRVVKHIYGQHSPDIDARIVGSTHVSGIVFLRRENTEAAALSALIAKQTRDWNRRPDETLEPISVRSIRLLAEDMRRRAQVTRSLLERSGKKYIEITYEQLFGENPNLRKNTAAQAIHFLVGEHSGTPKMFSEAYEKYLSVDKKINTGDTYELIPNILEIRKHLPAATELIHSG